MFSSIITDEKSLFSSVMRKQPRAKVATLSSRNLLGKGFFIDVEIAGSYTSSAELNCVTIKQHALSS